jgi:hypothetical protein
MPPPPSVTPQRWQQYIFAAKITYESNGSDDSLDKIISGLEHGS